MKSLRNKFLIAVSLLTLFIGSLLFMTPIPGGIVIVAFSLFILIKESRFAKSLVYVARRQYSQVNYAFRYIETRAPNFFARTIKLTRPLRFLRRRQVAMAG